MSDFIYPAPFGVDIIQRIIPHRYPFLFLDRVTELTATGVKGYKNITMNEWFFPGHFPQRAVVPGVIQIEALAQLGAIWILSKPGNEGKIAYLMSVSNAKFRRPVEPGDRMDLSGDVKNLRSRTGQFDGVIHVNGREVSSATVFFAFAKDDSGKSSDAAGE